MNTSLEEKIASRSAVVGVVGLGYVGLPLAVAFARAGFRVLGVDTDDARVRELQAGESRIGDVRSEEVAEIVRGGRFHPGSDYSVLAQADAVFICVPTPYKKMKTPDTSYIAAAARGIAEHLRPGQVIILQSTTYPGTTEEEVLPILQSSGLLAGRDFHLAFAPERVNPGDRLHTVSNTPKVVGGFTPRCGELAARLLGAIAPSVFQVSNTRAAEMSKLLENVFRSVNIALVNELALLCERMGIDVWEVIQAAATKPFGFMAFHPGPGVGGHCIPVDPFYLSFKAREFDFYTKFIEFAAEVNEGMPHHVLKKVVEALNGRGLALATSRVLVLGAAFKPDIEDARNSPARRIIRLLLDGGARVQYNDPYVPMLDLSENSEIPAREAVLASVPLPQALAESDCVVIVTGHACYDYPAIVAAAPCVVDTCNATAGIPSGGKVRRLGAPPGIGR